MKIVICGSIDFTPKIKEIADILSSQGHEVDIPLTSQRIINGELTLEDFLNEKNKNGDAAFRESALRKISDDLIKRYHRKISESDAILVLNLDKKGISNYIGGNTFLEMGFAHILDKTIYLYNNIPDISYTDEINAMEPVILNGDLLKIK
jgi:nucleoside 2-deoxyribosyltransferase